jgi:transposase
LCNAHLLRELTFLWEECGQRWADKLINALLEWKKVVETAIGKGYSRMSEKRIQEIREEYREIVAKGMRANPPPQDTGPRRRGRKKKSKALNLVERLQNYEDEVLRFVLDYRVPFDNNSSERELRMIKVQQKISGTFRSYEGAVFFFRIRSYIATCRKFGLNVIEALSSVFVGEPLLNKFLKTT